VCQVLQFVLVERVVERKQHDIRTASNRHLSEIAVGWETAVPPCHLPQVIVHSAAPPIRDFAKPPGVMWHSP